MPKKQPNKNLELLEETYDNFDPQKDKGEWSEMLKKKDSANIRTIKGKTKQDNSCMDQCERFFNSHIFHYAIIVLVVLDCLFVIGELIIDYIEIHLSKTHNESDKSIFLVNQTDASHKNETDHFTNASHHEHSNKLALGLKILELICKYGSFTILLIFVIEILLKATLVPRSFCKFFEIFDAFVVLVSFSMNLYLLIVGVSIHALGGLLTILR